MTDLTGEPTPAQAARLAGLYEDVARHFRRNQLELYQPYPKQYEFHRAGVRCRERLLVSGNQSGKTHSAAHEVAFHTTGLYPDWWPGVRYDAPVTIWTGAATNELSREVIQEALLGTEYADKDHEDWGTGAIPADRIMRITKRQSNVSDVVETIQVRWGDGKRTSRINLKTFDQGREKWQGKKVPFIWLDEQEESIYAEALTRTSTFANGRIIQTFTPLKGLTPILESFLSPETPSPNKHYTSMTLWDAIGGVWEPGTPWAGEEWEGHLDNEKIAEMMDGWPIHERDARSKGIPMVGEGRVFPVAEEKIQCIPFEIPRHYARLAGHDFGIDHPAGTVWLAHDRGSDIVYLYDCYKEAQQTVVYHAFTIRKHGEWIPVAWPHDGINRGKDGRQVSQMYEDHDVNMLHHSARYKRDIGGAQDSEPACLDILERMLTGRFKVFASLAPWFDEFRFFHRKNGVIVPYKDDLMKATIYAMMMLGHAKTEPAKRRAPQPIYDRPIVGGHHAAR